MLDPQLLALLSRPGDLMLADEMADIDRAGDSGHLASVRATHAAACRQHEPAPAQGVSVVDLGGDTPNGSVSMRSYSPDRMAAPAGAIVALHGGSWVAGSFDTHDTLWRGIALACRTRVLALRYRLAPEHPWPAACDDVIACVRWVREHAGELGIDPTRIVLLGEEAGGHLAAIAALALSGDGGPGLLAQVLVSPVLASPARRRPDAGLSALIASLTPTAARRAQRLVDRLVDRAALGEACLDGASSRIAASPWPLDVEDLSGLPETYLVSAGLDPWHAHTTAWRDRLQVAGVSVMHECFDGMVHGFLSMGGPLAAAGHGQSRIAQFLRPLMRASTA